MAWKNIQSSFIALNKGKYFMAQMENGKVVIYHKLREQQVYKSVWTDKKYQSEFHGTNLLKKNAGGKSIQLSQIAVLNCRCLKNYD